MLKTVVLLNIFVETNIYILIILWWIESSKEHHLFEIEIYCNITIVFSATFDQCIISIPNKSISSFKTWTFNLKLVKKGLPELFNSLNISCNVASKVNVQVHLNKFECCVKVHLFH